MDQEIARLKELTEKSRAMVFFGGAGVSKESGIPDFRSVDGLYHQAYRYPPETILSRSFYEKNPEEFYRFYRDKMLYLDAEPNPAHKKLAQWGTGGTAACCDYPEHRRPAPEGGKQECAGASRLCPPELLPAVR